MTDLSSDNGELPNPIGLRPVSGTAYDRLLARCENLDFDDMTPAQYGAFVDLLPADEFMALLAMHDEYRNGSGDADTIESGWLIERGDSPADAPLYYAPYVHGSQWTEDSEDALRFARHVDAHRLAIVLAFECRVAEHCWG